MDLLYILQNTILYGILSLILTSFYAYGKYANLGVGALLTLACFVMYTLFQSGFSLEFFILLFSFIFVLLFLQKSVGSFNGSRKKEFFGLMLSLGVGLFLDNILGFFYSSKLIILDQESLGIFQLGTILSILIFFTLVLFKWSYIGKVFKSIYEKENVSESLGIDVNKIMYFLSFLIFVFFLVNAYLTLTTTGIRPDGNIFYLTKGIGIMILVGVSKIEYTFLGALIYVILEHIAFINLGFPIEYKETFVLFIIMIVLLFKPDGIFTYKKRKF